MLDSNSRGRDKVWGGVTEVTQNFVCFAVLSRGELKVCP